MSWSIENLKSVPNSNLDAWFESLPTIPDAVDWEHYRKNWCPQRLKQTGAKRRQRRQVEFDESTETKNSDR